MADFDKPAQRSVLNVVPGAPGHCTHCEAKSVAVALITVNKHGRRLTGAFSQFGYQSHGECCLHGGIIFERWDAWCSDCFAGVPPNDSVSSFTENETRAAWMWFIARMSAGTKLAMFKVHPVTPDQEERFLFIVNHEAKRLNHPQAIAKEYRLREIWNG